MIKGIRNILNGDSVAGRKKNVLRRSRHAKGETTSFLQTDIITVSGDVYGTATRATEEFSGRRPLVGIDYDVISFG